MAVIRVVAITDKGVVKPENEDRVFVGGGVLASGSCCIEVEEPALLAVFDGVSAGGHGAEASSLAAQSLAELAPDGEASVHDLAETASEGLAKASQEMGEKAASYGYRTTMATTVAGLSLANGEFVTFHAGDSRVYRCRGGFLTRRTDDHSVVQQLMDIGAPDDQIEWARANQAHVILRAVGLGPGQDAIDVSRAWPAFEGDVFLLCSDGLTEGVSDQVIEEALNDSGTDLQTKVTNLFNAALAGGSKDNISIMLAEVMASADEKETQDGI